ncbi:hypothetical protein CSKR_100298 [Clonorchis sinensis]|uniref:Uncharacterized protein n=1 Tax=Clonorchis sinensis TaxID=79923 RepID=A0A3R7BZI8_CLOSI|nr:hypothetical protein CSKR_100298 [Clonorchis sinensis]
MRAIRGMLRQIIYRTANTFGAAFSWRSEKDMLVSIRAMPSRPFSPCTTKAFAESPSNDTDALFAIQGKRLHPFGGRWRWNSRTPSHPKKLGMDLAEPSVVYGNEVKHRETRFIINAYETSSHLRILLQTLNEGCVLLCILSRQLVWRIQEAV